MSELSPPPTDSNILSIPWQHWFELLRRFIIDFDFKITNLFAELNVLGGQVVGVQFLIDNPEVKRSTADPTTSDILSNRWGIWKNTTTNQIRLWVNDGGTMRSLNIFPP